jgi:hypothetical protein
MHHVYSNYFQLWPICYGFRAYDVPASLFDLARAKGPDLPGFVKVVGPIAGSFF